MSEYYKRIEKIASSLTHRKHIDTAGHVVSAVSSHGRILVRARRVGAARALWLYRGLGQAWRLSVAKSVENRKSKIKNGSSKN